MCKEEEKELFRTELEASVYTLQIRELSHTHAHARAHTQTHSITLTHTDRVCFIRLSTRGSPGGFTGVRDKALKVGTQFSEFFAFESYFWQTFHCLRMGKRPQLYELWVMQDINCLHFIHYDALIMSLLFFEIVQNAIELRFEFRTLFKKVLQSSSRYFEVWNRLHIKVLCDTRMVLFCLFGRTGWKESR